MPSSHRACLDTTAVGPFTGWLFSYPSADSEDLAEVGLAITIFETQESNWETVSDVRQVPILLQKSAMGRVR